MSQMTLPAMDDGLLKKISTEPPRPVFPVLKHAEAMIPLVVVLASLPTLYAVAHRTLTEAGARQGLLSLQCLAAQNLNEFVDPAVAGAQTPLAFQPLLMNWLTVLGFWLFGVGSLAGQVGAAYLCTAGLIGAAYVLARRLGGERLGLFTAGLLAFNPQVLRLAQEPAPQSAAVLFALLALAGAVAHWQKSSSAASWQLLVGGVALGLCLLAGGPVALAVVAVLLIYAGCWKLDGWLRAPPQGVLDREHSTRRRAIRSVLILAATGFAVGGWRSLLMGSRYGVDFWESWFGIDDVDRPAAPIAAIDSGWLEWASGWNNLVLPLTVLSVVGAVVIVVELARSNVASGRRHRGLLVVWIAIAAVLWNWLGSGTPDNPASADFWTILLIVPLTMSAAVTLLALIDHQFSFPAAVGIGLATGLDLLLASSFTAASTLDDGVTSHGVTGWLALLTVAMIGSIAVWLASRSRSLETRRWGFLTGFVLFVVAVNCLWGGFGVRRTSAGDRELEDLRQGLARFPDVRRWTLVTPTTAETVAAQPPPELTYTLHCLWPGSSVSRAASWEALAVELESERSAGAADTRLIVCWCSRPHVRAVVPVGLLKSVATPGAYRGHEVSAFHPGEAAP